MLKRASEEPLGHADSIIADVLKNAETNHVINECIIEASSSSRNGTEALLEIFFVCTTIFVSDQGFSYKSKIFTLCFISCLYMNFD